MESVQEQETIATEIGTAVRHSAVYGLGNVLAKGIGFFMLPLYTHFLNPVDYGILEILDLSMSLFGMFLAMGMITALLRCYTGAKSAEQKRKIVSTALLFVFVTGLATFLIGLFFLRPVSTMVLGPKVPPLYLLLSFTSFILGYIGNIPRTYLRALDASGAFVTVDTITLFFLLALNVVFIAVLKIGLSRHSTEFLNCIFRAGYLAVRVDNSEGRIGLQCRVFTPYAGIRHTVDVLESCHFCS